MATPARAGSETRIPKRRTRPTTTPASGSLSSSCISGRSHEATVAWCSWRKRAPRASWDL
eukprot:637235-Alexandrium_andersonii.AAC.1